MSSRIFLFPFVALLTLGLLLAACSGDDDDGGDDGSDAAPEVTEPADGGDDTGDDTGDDADDDGEDDDSGDDSGDDGGNGGGAGDSLSDGSATLTIGDETWEFDGVGCIFSAEEAQNPDFPFNLAAFGESSTGARTQLSADIYDPSGEERHEGEGVSHNISLNDIDDFENPSVAWSSVGSFFAEGNETMLTIDGDNVHGEGVFDDETTDEIEMVPGTLEVTCR